MFDTWPKAYMTVFTGLKLVVLSLKLKTNADPRNHTLSFHRPDSKSIHNKGDWAIY